MHRIIVRRKRSPALILPSKTNQDLVTEIEAIKHERCPAPNRGFVGEGIASNWFAKLMRGGSGKKCKRCHGA